MMERGILLEGRLVACSIVFEDAVHRRISTPPLRRKGLHPEASSPNWHCKQITYNGVENVSSHLQRKDEPAPRNDYKYRSIADYEIRLLVLYTGNGREMIQYALVPSSINEPTPYEALSYCNEEREARSEIRIHTLEMMDGSPSSRAQSTPSSHVSAQHYATSEIRCIQ